MLWFPFSALLLILNLTVLASYQKSTDKKEVLTVEASPLADTSIFQINSANTSTSQVLGAEIVTGDARPLLLKQFLEEHESPMAPYAEHVVQLADVNGIDFRLTMAIAMCESNLGKIMPPGSFNAWGIAVYTGQQSGANFKDWPTAIAWVSRYLKERYYNKGIHDLKDIGAIYAPPSVATGYSWTNCVETFRDSIQ